MSTDLKVLDELYPLRADELFRQWVLTRESDIISDEWEQQRFKGWHLGFHPDAHVCMLRAGDGTAIGWVVEPLVYLHGAEGIIPETELILPMSAHAGAAEIERALYGRDVRDQSSGDGLVGEWVAILLAGSEDAPLQRVYLSATHSVVYHAYTQTVATTHNLIPELLRDESLSQAINPLATNSYYPFGLTPFFGLRRLLPNHCLDLNTFTPMRHWPRGDFQDRISGEEGATMIVEHSRRFLKALTARYDTFKIPLSAGRDSRAVLALLSSLVEGQELDVLLYTSTGDTLGSLVDVQAARQIASITSLPHQVERHEQEDGDELDRLRSFVRIGEGKAGSLLSARAHKQHQQEEVFALSGMAGETGRASYWKDRHYSADELTPQLLAQRIASPVTEEVIAAASDWLKGLPAGTRASVADTLDLAYVEQRLGCWDAPARYFFSGRRRNFSPMTATFNIETMLRLPENYRAAGVLQRDMVAYGWPELLNVPFNTATGRLRALEYWEHCNRYINRARVHLGALRRRLLGTSEHQ